jgi:hypothetical protein
VTKPDLDTLKADAVNKYAEYIQAEKRLWDVEDGFADIALYKAFKKTKSAFHSANQKWRMH